jgi:hypothetical protein
LISTTATNKAKAPSPAFVNSGSSDLITSTSPRTTGFLIAEMEFVEAHFR